MSAVPNFALPGGDPRFAPAALPDAPQGLRFAGDSGGFVGLLARGAALELATFGFYRFWLATAMRRHLWAATSLDGDALEYTGRARELFVGFLIGLAIIGPLAVVNFLLGIYAENLQAFASLPLGLFYFVFTQFALYRARRYRLTRTVWRGVRFWMAGSGWRYGWSSFGWLLLVIATAGIAYPWRAAALERYKMRHTYYGDLQGGFVGAGGALFKRVWWIWLMVVVSALAVGAIAATVARTSVGSGRAGAGLAVEAAAGFGMLAVLIVALIGYPLFRASEWRWWASGLRFGGVAFASSLPRRSVLVLYVKTAVMSFIVTTAAAVVLASTVVIGAALIGVKLSGLAHFDAIGGVVFNNYLGLAAIVFAYLVIALAALCVQRYYLQHELWRLMADHLTVSGLSAASTVAARGAADTAIGEGLADGLDVAGF